MGSFKKNIGIIGVGNCGGQVAFLAEKKYDMLFDSVYINTSESDLSMIRGELKFKIGNEGVIEGSGKNRMKMKQYLKHDIDKIIENERFAKVMSDKKYVFIVASTAGGTGSGAAPILLEVLRQLFPDTHFILTMVLPRIQDSLMEQGNTLEFLDELYKGLGEDTTYMVYDNESTTDKSPTEALEAVNENIVEDIRVLSGADNYPTPYESIDPADMESIIKTPGRLLVTRVKQHLTEKIMEDTSLDDQIIKSIKQSCHAETDRNKRVVRLGVITYFTEQVNKLYTSKLSKLNEFIGTPIERFNHNAINDKGEALNFLYLIASGLSPINDRAKKITARVEELKKALANDESSKYVLSENETIYDPSEIRKKEAMVKTPEKVVMKDIFSKFMK